MSELPAINTVKSTMIRVITIFFGVILTASLLLPAAAAVVHKWVDADGITHYSDEAPGATASPITQIDLPNTKTTDNKSGFHSIANQWERMHRERQQREKIKLEKARLQAAQNPPAPQVVYVEQPQETRYVVTYPRSRYRQHGYYRSHYKHGRHNARVNKKRIHGFQRAGMQRDHSSLGYFKHVQ